MSSDVTRRSFLTAGAGVAAGAALTAVSAEAAENNDSEKDNAVKIIAVATSPRKGKTTAAGLKFCLEAAAGGRPANRDGTDRTGRA